MALSGRVRVVVPSLGLAPGLEGVLASLRGELAGRDAELVWVHQGDGPCPALAAPRERLLRLAGASGFAVAVNAGIAAAGAWDWLALVNDDLELEPGWLDALLTVLVAVPAAAAVQGVNLRADRPDLVDGCGIAWNRWWQAVQVGVGQPAPARTRPPFEVFGVSATGALFRRAALAGAAAAAGGPFDERLGSWYEDVDLAVRLRAAGHGALCVPAARARHFGSATGARRPFARGRLLVANRWLVVARLLGRRFPAALPRLAARDLADLARALAAGRWAHAAAFPAGWARAAIALPRYLSAGATLVPLRTLARFRVGSGQ